MVRCVSIFAVLAALGSALAFAEEPQLANISYSPEFQAQLEEDYGVREGAYLSRAIDEAIADAIAARGAAINSAVSIDVTIVDADPNRPTFQQLSDEPGLDGFRSISIGGAELRAVLRAPDGSVIGEVSHRRYNHSLEDVAFGGATTWSEAQRAIRQFANKVADAYVETAR